VKFNWDIAMVPKGKQSRVIYGGPDQSAIAAHSPHPDESWEWLNYISGQHRPLQSFDVGVVPFYRPSAESNVWLATGNPPSHMKIILDSQPYVRGAEFGHNWIKWRIDAMNSALAGAFLGNEGVKAAATKACEQIDEILKEPF